MCKKIFIHCIVKQSGSVSVEVNCCGWPSPEDEWSGGAWCGAAVAVCSIRPFLLWSLLCSSHLINNDCTSHWNFPFSIFCHHPPQLAPTTQLPPDQQQDKWCPTTWWLATQHPHQPVTQQHGWYFKHTPMTQLLWRKQSYWSSIAWLKPLILGLLKDS